MALLDTISLDIAYSLGDIHVIAPLIFIISFMGFHRPANWYQGSSSKTPKEKYPTSSKC